MSRCHVLLEQGVAYDLLEALELAARTLPDVEPLTLLALDAQRGAERLSARMFPDLPEGS